MSNQNKTVATSAQTSKNSNKKENQNMENITKLISNQRNDNVIDVFNEMNKRSNLNMGIASIEFPDGTVEKYYYNGEADKQAAVDFAQICLDACNSDSRKAKRMMYICFMLKSKGITPTEIVELNDGNEYYIDHKQRILVDGSGNTIVALTDDEKKQVGNSKGAISLILKERANRLLEEDYNEYDDYDEDDDPLAELDNSLSPDMVKQLDDLMISFPCGRKIR